MTASPLPPLTPVARIPNVIHFCFGLGGADELHFFHYLAVLSALAVNRPDAVLFHYEHEPAGPWWPELRRLVTPIKVVAPREIFGRPLVHYAHRADVLRLHVLIEHGGIYLDLDTLCLRPLTKLLSHDFVMGQQRHPGESIYGLCNAVLLACPQSAFALRWLEHYRTFRSTGHDAHWDEHSVTLPLSLARAHPLDISVLDRFAFFHPTWPTAEAILFREPWWNFRSLERASDRQFAQSYVIHLWERFLFPRLRRITPHTLRRERNLYSHLAHRFV